MVVGGEGDWKAPSRDGGSEGLHWWRWELKQGFAGSSGHGCGRTGLRARLHWELQFTLGGGEYEVACCPTPSPAYINFVTAAEGSLPPIFRYFERIWPCWPFCIPKKNFKLNIITYKNYDKIYYMTHN